MDSGGRGAAELAEQIGAGAPCFCSFFCAVILFLFFSLTSSMSNCQEASVIIPEAVSARASAKVAAAFVSDGACGEGNKRLAKSIRERDLFKWLTLPFSGYLAEVPLLGTAKPGEPKRKQLSNEQTALVLPSDVLHEIHQLELQDDILVNLNCSPKNWRENDHDIDKVAAFGAEFPFEETYPLVFHEDAVPNWHDESAVFWSWSVPLNGSECNISRHCVIGLPSSRVAPQTRHAICSILRWDLMSCQLGIFPEIGHDGNALTGSRLAKANKPIMGGRRALFSFWKGDMEAHKVSHNLARNYLRNFLCDRRMAQKNNLGLTYIDF